MTARTSKPSAASQPAPQCDTVRERARRLAPFGYRQIDAEFLAATALLGGFFLRRQYRAFAQARPGGTECVMVSRAEGHRHVRVTPGFVHLYRLCGTSLFEAIGCEDPAAGGGRARRAVKQRLLALDYWITTRRESRLLLSPAEKSAYFASLGISADRFPAAARHRQGAPRHFPDVFPIGVPDQRSPSLRFSYAHAGAGESGMRRHLEVYEPLSKALAERGIACEWAILADSEVQFSRLRRAWQSWLARVERDWSEGEYFPLRLAVETRRWQSLSRDSINRYAQLGLEHANPAADARYTAWVEAGAPPREPGGDFAQACRHREVLMEFDYSAADAAER